jgi:capsule polysaccharide export protein KpsE/RkpR
MEKKKSIYKSFVLIKVMIFFLKIRVYYAFISQNMKKNTVFELKIWTF